MTPEQQKLIEQARLYAEHDEYAVTRTYIRGLLDIIEQQAATVPTTIAPPDWLESEYPNGMMQQDVHNELHDYKIMLDNVPSVYEHVTGGNTSNPMVLAPTVIALADDWANQSYDDGVSDARDELVPDGWKLVPVEPTKEMVDASIYCALSNKGKTPTEWVIARYKSMLAAAPEALKS